MAWDGLLRYTRGMRLRQAGAKLTDLRNLHWSGFWLVVLVLTLAALGLAGCVSLPPKETLDVPPAGDGIPVLPAYDDPLWIHQQGIPLRKAWLREGRTPVAKGEMFILPHVLSDLPYKNLQETEPWIAEVNQKYAPSPAWRFNPERRMGHYKCMSVSASTVVDWHLLELGRPLGTYRSLLHGKEERGFDSRLIDAIYYQRAADGVSGYPLLWLEKDPIERTPISYRMESFAKIITMAGAEGADPDQTIDTPDPGLPGVSHRFKLGELPRLHYRTVFNYQPTVVIAAKPEPRIRQLVEALEQDGPVLAGIRVRFATSGGVMTATEFARLAYPTISGHAVVVVGYIRQEGRTYFVYREVFGDYDEAWLEGGPAYRVFPVQSFNEAYVFHS